MGKNAKTFDSAQRLSALQFRWRYSSDTFEYGGEVEGIAKAKAVGHMFDAGSVVQHARGGHDFMSGEDHGGACAEDLFELVFQRAAAHAHF